MGARQDGAGTRELAALIDHTLLRVDATPDDVSRLCGEAREHGFASVCVRVAHVALASANLQGTGVKVVSVVDFPLGSAATSARVAETAAACELGADEIDVVLPIAALKHHAYAAVEDDLRAVVGAAAPRPVKVILETGALTDEQKIVACALAVAAGAAFVKTSTGFGQGGATALDVALLRRVVGPRVGVKASGGVRTTDDAIRMIAAGANRIGTSASVAIVAGQTDQSEGTRAAFGKY